MKPIFEKMSGEALKLQQRICMAAYLDGSCYCLAIALSRGTGWPMVGIMHNGVVRHAGVRDHYGKFHDARGVVPENEIGEPFGLKPPYDIQVVTERTLQRIKRFDELAIESASVKAEMLWPELPWKETVFKSRVLSFLEELDQLCRKHRVWVRAHSMDHDIWIEQEAGGEVLIVRPAITGNYCFSRKFKSQTT